MSELRSTEGGTDEDHNMPSLRPYLSRVRSLVFGSSASKIATSRPSDMYEKSVLVMGNPSADLDSFISAVVTSYFYNLKSNAKQAEGRTYIPILNLPFVRASELWRQRPEFGVALRLALGESPNDIGEGGEQGKASALEELITIADIKADSGSPLHALFIDSKTTQSQSANADSDEKQSLFLVDHNSPTIPGLSDEDITAKFHVTGCIDHHVDENYVSQDAIPRIITTGIGSCASLVVKHLRDQGMWPSQPESNQETALHEISRLALAPILIDTSNLTATGDKCSDTDRDVVKFLESWATTSPSPAQSQLGATSTTTAQQPWDRNAFHSAISTAKSNSLNLLSMQEILNRDYKAWTERTKSPSGVEVNIGISSLVKPLAWLTKHAGGIDQFLTEVEKFATGEERHLGVFCLLTRTGDGRKEVIVQSFDEAAKGVIQEFEERAGELQLKEWGDDQKLIEAFKQKFDKDRAWKIWYMGDTSKSRKQVGPLLREAVRNV